MTDTPQFIKDIQLRIWLAKPPMERLKQMMEDNEELFRFWSYGINLKSSKINSEFSSNSSEFGDAHGISH